MFNTETGSPGVGRWGMMDQGSANLNGLVPPIPNAWVREYMGWIVPVEAKVETAIALSHAESGSDTLAWKVAIDDDEYFLIENRNNFLRPFWSLDSIRNFKYEENNNKGDYPSILPLIKDSLNAVISSETGVLLSVPKYDIGLPGSGLLIWHIDESVIDANIKTNSINNDREKRGVNLQEADGAQDIGFPPANIFSDVSNGWGFDAWFSTNEGFWDINKNIYKDNNSSFIGFTDKTYPSTRTNDNIYTGIRIDSIGPSGSVMNFTIAFDTKQVNFPISFKSNTSVKKMIFCDYNNDGNDEFIIVSDRIYFYDGIGNLLSQIEYVDNINDVGNLEALYSSNKLYLVFESGTKLLIQEYDIDNDGEFELDDDMEIDNAEITSNIQCQNDVMVFGTITEGNSFYVCKIEDDEIVFYDFKSRVTKIGTYEDRYFYLVDEGEICSSSFDITTIEITKFETELPISFALGKTESDFINSVITFDNSLVLTKCVFCDDKEIIRKKINCKSNPILSDINGNGINDIIVAGSKQIYAFDQNLLLLPNFPIDIPNLYKDKEFGESLFSANFDNDNNSLEIVAFIEDVGLVAFNGKGELLSNYPSATIIPVGDLSGLYNYNNKTYCLSVGKTKMNSIKISDNCLDEKSWSRNGYNGNSYYYAYKPNVNNEINDSLIDKKKTFCWPNPVQSNESFIRYIVTESCDVSINIFDIAGNFVKSFSQNNPNINYYNEVTWDVSDVESGVYYAIVKAEKGNNMESKTVKIMVIK